MKITAQTLAALLGGEIVGDPETVVTGPARIEQGKPGDICFFANPKYEKYVYDTKASILLVNKSFVPAKPVPTLVKANRMAAPSTAPMHWKTMYQKASLPLIRPESSTPRVMAGLMWHPLMPPIV